MLINNLPIRAAAREIDALLIQRIQKRDPEALGELYDLYGRLIYSLIFRIVRDGGISDDLVQETFLRVWRGASLFDSGKGSFGGWLLAVARNRALEYIRSSHGRWNARTRPLAHAEESRLLVDCGSGRPLSNERIAVREALLKLNVEQRAVIDLAYFEGYSQSQIATKLGRPLGTVKTWTRAALSTLRLELAPCSSNSPGATGVLHRPWMRNVTNPDQHDTPSPHSPPGLSLAIISLPPSGHPGSRARSGFQGALA